MLLEVDEHEALAIGEPREDGPSAVGEEERMVAGAR